LISQSRGLGDVYKRQITAYCSTAASIDAALSYLV
jgi:hypothetical protein